MPNISGAQRWQLLFSILGILATVSLAYLPGLHGPFVLDDTENITLNPGIALNELDAPSLYHALVSNDSGPLKRPLAALSFAINHYLAGGFDNTFPFKLTNLLIHGINGILVFFLTLRLMNLSLPGATLTGTQRHLVSALAAGLWALHPIQLTNVLYVVQRMNSLSALFVFSGLLVFLHGRVRLKAHPRHGLWLMALGVLGGTALGILAKENAVLLPLLALVIEFTVIRDLTRPGPLRRKLRIFYSVTVAIPLLIGLLLLLFHPDSLLGGYLARPFTPLERMLTEARVLWHYLGLLLWPIGGNLGLFHDDISVSTGLFTPLSTFPAVAALCLLLAAAVAKARQYPMLAFGILWYLAGHILESSLLGLEIAFEHRNYVPSMGIFLSLSYGAVMLVNRLDSRHQRYLLILFGLVPLLAGAVTWVRATTWGDIHTLSVTEARHHPRSPRANDLAARVTLERGDISAAVHYTLQGLKASPRETGFHVDLQILLTHLAFDINGLVEKRFSPRVRGGAVINVQGLPAEIETLTGPDGISLRYPESSNEIISRLLHEQPVTAHTVVSFENLTHCLTSKQPSCQSLLSPALDWLGLGLKNPRTGKIYRGILAANAARLHALREDYRRALEFMDLASAQSPRHLSYRLAQIDYLLRLGLAGKAADTMEQLKQEWPQNDIQWTINRSLTEGIMGRLRTRGN
ncbi:MAG: hypothetical protein OEM83_04195 [Gammaproteobacteria bacterium]|nr:hypothetical protein [Gammaproteobacteria bacterium]